MASNNCPGFEGSLISYPNNPNLLLDGCNCYGKYSRQIAVMRTEELIEWAYKNNETIVFSGCFYDDLYGPRPIYYPINDNPSGVGIFACSNPLISKIFLAFKEAKIRLPALAFDTDHGDIVRVNFKGFRTQKIHVVRDKDVRICPECGREL